MPLTPGLRREMYRQTVRSRAFNDATIALFGKIAVTRDGTDVTVIGRGMSVHESLKAADDPTVLRARRVRVCTPDIPIPFTRSMEQAILSLAGRIAEVAERSSNDRSPRASRFVGRR